MKTIILMLALCFTSTSFAVSLEQEVKILTQALWSDQSQNERLLLAIDARNSFLEDRALANQGRYLIVNRSQYVLRVIENGVVVIEDRVVVGRQSRKTPLLESEIKHVVMNPYWNVPHRGRTQRDVVRKLNILLTQAERVKYINYKGYRFFQSGGEVSPWSIDFENFPRDIKIRQDPGPLNSLGRVKFIFPNKYSVYIHDTPAKNLFNKETREFSSGCIRLRNPENLASYLLGKSTSTITQTMQSSNPTERWLRIDPLPVFVVDGEGWNTWIDENGNIKYKEMS